MQDGAQSVNFKPVIGGGSDGRRTNIGGDGRRTIIGGNTGGGGRVRRDRDPEPGPPPPPPKLLRVD